MGTEIRLSFSRELSAKEVAKELRKLAKEVSQTCGPNTTGMHNTTTNGEWQESWKVDHIKINTKKGEQL